MKILNILGILLLISIASASVSVPANQTYFSNISSYNPINITYTAINNTTNYSIYVLYPNGTVERTLSINNSPNLNYTWLIPANLSGQYLVQVNASNATDLLNTSLSGLFYINNTTLTLSIAWLPNASLDQSIINHLWFAAPYSQSTSLPTAYISTTCYANQSNGAAWVNASTANYLLQLLNLTLPETLSNFKAFCEINVGGVLSRTDVRTINMEIPPVSNQADFTIFGTVIGLAIIVFIFAYLYANSKSWIWAQLWFIFSILVGMTDMMVIQSYGIANTDTQLAGIAMALFLAFFAVFLIAIVRLIWTLYKNYIDEFMAVLDGRRKKDKS